MITIQRVRTFEDVPVNIDDSETFTFQLMEAPPNADGLYEVSRAAHFVYPPLVAEGLLKKAGYIYVSHKKGNYDIELWRKVVQTIEELKPDGTLVAEMRLDLAAIMENKQKEVDAVIPPPLVPTTQGCYQCGMRIDKANFIFGNPDKQKIVQLSVCINPACNFHYVEVVRG